MTWRRAIAFFVVFLSGAFGARGGAAGIAAALFVSMLVEAVLRRDEKDLNALRVQAYREGWHQGVRQLADAMKAPRSKGGIVTPKCPL
jgi:hypothetical protein